MSLYTCTNISASIQIYPNKYLNVSDLQLSMLYKNGCIYQQLFAPEKTWCFQISGSLVDKTDVKVDARIIAGLSALPAKSQRKAWEFRKHRKPGPVGFRVLFLRLWSPLHRQISLACPWNSLCLQASQAMVWLASDPYLDASTSEQGKSFGHGKSQCWHLTDEINLLW